MTYKDLINAYKFTNRAYRLIFSLSNRVKTLEDYLEKKNETVDFSIEEFKEKYLSKKPIERITNEVYFCGESFYLMDGVFCPRDETELLIDEASKLGELSGKYIDLCSGTGVIGITMLKKHKKLEGTLLDISSIATENIKINLKKNNLVAEVINEDWLKHMQKNTDYQIISANFPYLDKEEVKEKIYDPDEALFADEKGWKHYGDLIQWMKQNTHWKIVILECSVFHENIWKQIKVDNWKIKLVKDMRNFLRVAVITR